MFNKIVYHAAACLLKKHYSEGLSSSIGRSGLFIHLLFRKKTRMCVLHRKRATICKYINFAAADIFQTYID